ncbi:hypothetical protein JCM5296_005610 [Sporobolomyces johnsonii]
MTDVSRIFGTNWTMCRQYWIQFLLEIIDSLPTSVTLSLIQTLTAAIAPLPCRISAANPTTIVARFIDTLHKTEESD